jgi:cell division protein FtsQ
MSGEQRRGRAGNISRTIVRRTRPAVGSRRKESRQQRGEMIGAKVALKRTGLHLPTWRPGRGSAIVAVIVAFIGVLAGSGYAAYHSPFFEVSQVQVRGNSDVSTSLIVERAGLMGDRMFNADLASAQRSIYSIPQLESVRLERSWPDTIVVYVEEREPWGVWEQGGLSYTIDREGVVISTTGVPSPPPGAPVIISSEVGARQLGDRVDHHAVAVATDIYELLPERLGTTVTEVAFLTGKGVQVTTSDGQTAILGDSSGIDYKLAVWEAVSATARNEGIEYTVIDLRYGNRPVLH